MRCSNLSVILIRKKGRQIPRSFDNKLFVQVSNGVFLIEKVIRNNAKICMIWNVAACTRIFHSLIKRLQHFITANTDESLHTFGERKYVFFFLYAPKIMGYVSRWTWMTAFIRNARAIRSNRVRPSTYANRITTYLQLVINKFILETEEIPWIHNNVMFCLYAHRYFGVTIFTVQHYTIAGISHRSRKHAHKQSTITHT